MRLMSASYRLSRWRSASDVVIIVAVEVESSSIGDARVRINENVLDDVSE